LGRREALWRALPEREADPSSLGEAKAPG